MLIFFQTVGIKTWNRKYPFPEFHLGTKVLSLNSTKRFIIRLDNIGLFLFLHA